MVSSQVAIDLWKFDTEPPNLDLTVSPACNSAVTRVVEKVPKIPSTVDPIAWTLVILPPGLVGVIGNFVIGLDPDFVVDKPVVEELFLSILWVVQISVRSNVSRYILIKTRRTLISAKPAALIIISPTSPTPQSLV